MQELILKYGGMNSDTTNIWQEKTLYFDYDFTNRIVTVNIEKIRREGVDFWELSIIVRRNKDIELVENFLEENKLDLKRDGKKWLISNEYKKKEEVATFAVNLSKKIIDYRNNK